MELGSSGFVKPLQRGKDWSLCSNESTCPEGSLQVSHTGDILKGNLDSMGSSMSRPENHRNRIQYASAGHGLCRHVSHLLLTIPSAQCHTACVMSLAEARRYGERSEAVSCRYKSQHRVESMPRRVSVNLDQRTPNAPTLIAAYKARAMSLLCSNLGLLPRISGNQN